MWLTVTGSLGWQSGDVVGIEAGSGRLEVCKFPNPNDTSLTTVAEDGIPVPPHWLIQMVIGKPTVKDFVESGHRVAKLFTGLMRRHLSATKKPAVVLVIYRGDGFLSGVRPPARRQKLASLRAPSGMGYKSSGYWDGLFPAYYGGAHHSEAYVRDHWGRFFDVLELSVPKDTGLFHDLGVLRRRP